MIFAGGSSDLCYIKASVPKGSILSHLLFLVYNNDVATNIVSIINLFADDTSLSMVAEDPNETGAELQSDIDKINDCANRWLVKFVPSISEPRHFPKKK